MFFFILCYFNQNPQPCIVYANFNIAIYPIQAGHTSALQHSHSRGLNGQETYKTSKFGQHTFCPKKSENPENGSF